MSARRRRRTSAAPGGLLWLASLAGIALVAVAALTIIKKGMRLRDDREALREARLQQALAPSSQPFADLEREEAPEVAGGPSDPAAPFAGADAARAFTSVAWTSALALAEEAEPLYEACVAAKRAGNMERANAKGRLARRKYDEALESTAAWEERLIDEHGESDPGVREVMRIRDQWFDRVRWLHKSVAR